MECVGIQRFTANFVWGEMSRATRLTGQSFDLTEQICLFKIFHQRDLTRASQRTTCRTRCGQSPILNPRFQRNLDSSILSGESTTCSLDAGCGTYTSSTCNLCVSHVLRWKPNGGREMVIWRPCDSDKLPVEGACVRVVDVARASVVRAAGAWSAWATSSL